MISLLEYALIIIVMKQGNSILFKIYYYTPIITTNYIVKRKTLSLLCI